MNKSLLESTLLFQIRAVGLPEPAREFKAIPDRRYKWDFCWENERLLIEVQGSIWKGKNGGHSSGTGIMRDHEKNNLAVIEGYRVIYVNGNTIASGEAITTIEKALEA